MSSNNQILIIKKNKCFEIHLNSCVDNEFEPDKESFLKEFDELKEAIKYANEYCSENLVEYGSHIDGSCLE